MLNTNNDNNIVIIIVFIELWLLQSQDSEALHWKTPEALRWKGSFQEA